MSNLLKSKFFLGALVVAVMFVGAVAVKATPAKAECSTGTATLKVGSTGEAVKCLQAGVGAIADGVFGPATKAKVATWQASVGLTVDGVFGPMSRAKFTGGMGGTYPAGCMSSSGFSTTTGLPCTTAGTFPAGCTSAVGYSPTTGAKCDSTGTTTGPLTGNAGSITVTALSTYGDEQVGENESDVKLAAFEVEADNGSDISISSMKVELNQQNTADSEDVDDYMKSVSIWMGSTKVGEADVTTFAESSSGHVWTKSVSLTNAVVKAGETVKFYVAVTALANLDSGDMDSDDWQIGVSNIRFLDGDGVVTTESLTLDIDDNVIDDTVEEEFDFASFATAGDVELKVALKTGSAAEAINEAHVINVESGTTDTDDVKVLNFTLKAEGSDLNVSEIPVLFTTTGEADEAVILIAAKLWHDGEEVASETVPTGGAVTFDGLDIDITDGDSEEFTVTVDLQDLTGALDAGDTVKAELTATEVDAIVAEDESGEELAAGDLTGTAAGEASATYDSGIMVDLVSVAATVTNDGDAGVATSSQTGSFSITFDVTAFDDDMRLDDNAIEDTAAPFDVVTQLSYSITDTANDATQSPSMTSSTGATHDTESFLIEEDQTERFTVTVAITPTSSGFFSVKLEGLGWTAGNTDAAGANIFTFGLDDFKTGDLYLVEYD